MPCIEMENRYWRLAVDEMTGALVRIAHPHDTDGMNWICSSRDTPSFSDCRSFGLGFLNSPAPSGMQRWQRVTRIRRTRTSVASHYGLGGVDLVVKRSLRGATLQETYEFRNNGCVPLTVWGIGLYAPFNDNYPDADTCVARRCNAHLWCGGHTAYACCLRMGGHGPHLGMVLADGFINGYSIEDRGVLFGSSNTRGTIVFNASGLTLKPKKTHRLSWTCFWHEGWDDFLEQAAKIPQFADVRVDEHTVVSGKPLAIRCNRSDARIEGLSATPGEQVLKVRYDGRETWACVNVVPKVDTLIRRRARFLCEHQQVTGRRDPLYGAFLSYDNALKTRVSDTAALGQSEGAERLGMGVLLAQCLQRWRDKRIEKATRLYHRFVRTKLQRRDGTVLASVSDATQRLYNYPWVAQLHLEMYRAFGEKRFLRDCCQTLRTYYRRGGEKFYAIGIPMYDAVEDCEKAGMKRDAAALRKAFLAHGDRVVAAGLHLPPHEVNYEQTIVGPAVVIALEAYLISRNEKYLRGVKPLLEALEAFGGRQPDHHLHEIAIRHWDGYWFGGLELWGDTFPHYWSAVTGWAFYRYWQATGDESYRRRGREVLLNNLSAFAADGSARCIYIYPDAVNGNPGRRWDPLANDQDWALVFLMQAGFLDPAFVKECWRPPARRSS